MERRAAAVKRKTQTRRLIDVTCVTSAARDPVRRTSRSTFASFVTVGHGSPGTHTAIKLLDSICRAFRLKLLLDACTRLRLAGNSRQGMADVKNFHQDGHIEYHSCLVGTKSMATQSRVSGLNLILSSFDILLWHCRP